MATKRKDKSRVVLKTGEVQRKDGTYQFSWQDSQMKRRFVYARTLDDLREKEKRIQKDKCDGIKTEARSAIRNRRLLTQHWKSWPWPHSETATPIPCPEVKSSGWR